jgi:hypothetical protein
VTRQEHPTGGRNVVPPAERQSPDEQALQRNLEIQRAAVERNARIEAAERARREEISKILNGGRHGR